MLTGLFTLMGKEGSNGNARKIPFNIHKNMGFVEKVRVYCDILGSQSGVAEDPSSLGYYAV